MLSRIFNWVKFKTLPPSVNFKNRLFIERHNKDRRTISNLGNTFRNSKWASYNRSNLSWNTFTNFVFNLRPLGLFLIFVCIVFKSSKYLTLNRLFADLLTTLWFVSDSTLNLVLSSSLFLLISGQSIIISFFEKYNLVRVPHLNSPKFEINPTINQQIKDKRIDQKILYQWALFSQSTKISSLEPLLKSSANNQLNQRVDFYHLLFNSITSSTLTDSIYNLDLTKSSQPIESFIPNYDLSYFTLTLNYSLNRLSESRSNYSSLWPLNSLHRWTLLTLTRSLNSNPEIILSRGLFVRKTNDFTTLNLSDNVILKTLPSIVWLKEQTNWIKISRWLSKYTILHRHNIVNSHKNTLTKRLIQSGFYSNDFAERNISACSIESLSANFQNLMKTAHDKGYRDFFSTTTLSQNSSSVQIRWFNPSVTHYLSFDEDSLFWFSKRFYHFNTLGANNRELLPTPPTHLSKNLKILTDNNQMLNFILSQTNNSPTTPNQTFLQPYNQTEEVLKSPLTTNLTTVKELRHGLFNYDFTPAAVLLLQKPVLKTNVVSYYSTLNHTLDLNDVDLKIHKFKL